MSQLEEELKRMSVNGLWAGLNSYPLIYLKAYFKYIKTNKRSLISHNSDYNIFSKVSPLICPYHWKTRENILKFFYQTTTTNNNDVNDKNIKNQILNTEFFYYGEKTKC